MTDSLPSSRARSLRRSLLTYLLAALVAIQTLAPLAWMLISTISTKNELLSVPPHWVPNDPTLDNYRTLLAGDTVPYRGVGDVAAPIDAFGRGMLNSLIVAGATTLLCLVAGTLAAFAFARLRFRFKSSLFLLVLAVQTVPSISVLVPLYVLLGRLELLDTHLGLVLVYSTFTVGLVIWVMTGYIQAIPRELEEAAQVDGCSRLGAFRRVVLPLVGPGLVATGALAFLGAWNEFLFALTFTTNQIKTVPVVIAEFSTQFSLEYGLMMTGGLLASLPPVLLALVFQKRIISGLTAGGVKG